MTDHDLDPLDLLTTGEAARAAGVDPSAVYRAACRGRLRIAAHTRSGTRLYHARDVAEYRRARLARLARQLRAVAEPRDGDPWDAAQSAALDLAIAVEEREP